MRIRWKLVGILVVPLIALAGLAYAGVRDRRDLQAKSETVRAATNLAAAIAGVANGLENESVLSAQKIGSSDPAVADALKAQRDKTDKAVATFRSIAPAGESLTDVGSALTRANRSIDGLPITRSAVDSGGDQGINALTVYQFSVERIREVTNQIAIEQAGNPGGGELSAYAALGRAKDAEAQELALLAVWATGGTLTDAQVVQLNAAQTKAVTQTEVFLTLAKAADKQRFRSATAGPSAEDLNVLRQEYTEGASASGLARVQSASGVLADLRTVENIVEGEIASDAANRAQGAANDTKAFLLFALAAFGFALLSASMFGRSISRPIALLTKAARRVSNEHLPRLLDTVRGNSDAEGELVVEPINLGTRDELGELAQAFNSIQETAVAVAGEQADLIRRGIGELFVNLARRNQSLLDRQIGFLDELEANETDSEVLADLFKLDHLATRMRRNAESLLVLAGTETPRRWGKPVPLSDVVRAAIGEVEDYARIRIVGLDERPVHGAVAADLAHLLAELLDNASQYSPPETTVEVHGTAVPGGYRLAVRDFGIGMTDDQRSDINTTLADPPRTGLHLSRSLGFAVVGRLAVRHAVSVELHHGDGGGLLATVAIPAALLVGVTNEEAAETARPSTVEAPRAVSIASDPITIDDRPDATIIEFPSRPDIAASAGRSDAPDHHVEPVEPAARHQDVSFDAPAFDSPSVEEMIEVEVTFEAEVVATAGAAASVGALGGVTARSRSVDHARVEQPRQDPHVLRGRPDDVPAAVWARLVGGGSSPLDRKNSVPAAGWSPADHQVVDAPEPPPPPSVVAEVPLAAPPPMSLSEAVPTGDRFDAGLNELLAPKVSPSTTRAGLPKRKAVEASAMTPATSNGDGAVASGRTPDEIRSLLSNYRGGLDRGRRVFPTSNDEGANR